MNPSSLPRLAFRWVTLILASASVGCDQDRHTAEWWQGEQERIELSHRLDLQQFRHDQLDRMDFQTYEKLHRTNAAAAVMVKSLREQSLALGGQVEKLQTEWISFRENVLHEQRQRAQNAKFETLTLVTGRKFEDVSVSAINDAGVTIRHANGSARLGFADLDADQRRFFGLDADLAVVAVAAEKQNAVAYEQWVDDRLVAMDAKKAKASEVASIEATAAREVRANFDAQLIAASSTRALAQPSRSVGSRSTTYYYNNYSGYNPYRSYYNYYGSAPSGCYDTYSRQAAVQQLGNEFRSQTGYGTATGQPRVNFADTTLPSIP